MPEDGIDVTERDPLLEDTAYVATEPLQLAREGNIRRQLIPRLCEY